MIRRKVFIILLALVLIFALATACRTIEESIPSSQEPAADPTTVPEPAPEDTEEPGAVRNINLQWAVCDANMIHYYNQLIEAYKDMAPHVTVELVELGVYNWNNVIMTHLIGGHDYDIINVRDVPGYVMHVSADTLIPLNDKATARGIEISDYMGIPEQFIMDGSYYALPFMSEFWVVFYNKDIFDELNEPEDEDAEESEDDLKIYSPSNEMTFEEWTELIKEVTRGSGEDKVWGNFFQNSRSATTLFGILDGRHTVNDGNYNFLEPFYEAIIALESGRYVQSRADIIANNIDYSDIWLSGYLAQLNTGTWFIADTLNSGFNWGIASYPVPTSANYGNTFGNVTQLAIPRSANHPEEAMDFIAFITGEQGAQILASAGYIPAMITDTVLDIILDNTGFPQDDITRGALRPKKLFLEQPPNDNAEEISAILDEIHNEIMDKSVSIDEGIAMMNEQIKALAGN